MLLFTLYTSAVLNTHTHTPAGSLLHPLVAVQDALEQLRHEGFEVGVGWLAHHPVGVAAQSPAGDRANQSFLITQTLDQVRDQLRQVWDHALHTAYIYKRRRREGEREGRVI